MLRLSSLPASSRRENLFASDRIIIVKWDRLFAGLIFSHVRALCPKADIVICRSSHEARQALRECFSHLVLLGLALPDEDGLDLLARILQERLAERVMVVSGRRDERTRESLHRQRIAGYFDPEMEEPDMLPVALRAVLEGRPWFSTIPSGRDTTDGARPLSQLLSPTELQVFAVTAEGLDDLRAGERLGLSEHTVRTHRQHLMRKLGVQTSRELIVEAIRRGVIRVLPDRIQHPGLEQALSRRAAQAASEREKAKERSAIPAAEFSAHRPENIILHASERAG